MRIDYQNAILFLLCLVLLLSVFTLSAFASPDSFLNITDGGSYPVYQNSAVTVHLSGFNGSGQVYLFCNTSTNRIKALLTSSGASGSVAFTGSYFSIDSKTQFGSVWVSNSYQPVGQQEVLSTIPSFASDQEAVNEFLSVTPEPETSIFEYTLPPGNVAYIPIPRVQSDAITYKLTTTYYMAFGNNDTSRINQVVTVMSSLPSSSNNVAPSSPKIPWTNNGNVNLLGVSANKIYQGSIPSNYGGQYLVIVNPMTMPSQTGLIGGDTYTNGSINISVSAVSGSPHIYPMTESLTISPGDGIGSESSYGDSGYTYEVNPETGEMIWTDPSGGSSAPIAGGNNPMPSPNTIFDWLRNISQQFSDFLRGPVQSVRVVVSAIRDFMGSFTQLYQWLPSPVYSLITSALMIALTIGVIKIFV